MRVEYDGLNLLRVDEIYGASLSESGPWRTVEVSTQDPVGNVLSVFDNSGNEEFYFAQDAFGNELPINSAFGASDWGNAARGRFRLS
jgi:hypothetical protein